MRSSILAALLIAFIRVYGMPNAESTTLRVGYDSCFDLTYSSQPAEAMARQFASERVSRSKVQSILRPVEPELLSKPANTRNNSPSKQTTSLSSAKAVQLCYRQSYQQATNAQTSPAQTTTRRPAKLEYVSPEQDLTSKTSSSSMCASNRSRDQSEASKSPA